jgi:hypothetical protein
MNIFGEGFADEILKQIDYRQTVYGSGYDGNRTNEEILYLNANSAWCKLLSGVDISSSVDINNPTIKNLRFNNSELAQKFVLFNGTFDTTNGEQKSGISPVNSILGDNYAYGIGGTDFGIRPMMGIQSANIKHENRGSLRRAEVKIKAFNRAQFEIIDALYLRLGFTVLLEWGHSIIINNAGEIDSNPINISLGDEFLKGNLTYDEFLKKIYDQRLATGGNYDAMLAKVANFSWSFLPDGSYDITLYLSSIGDLIESLKINILTDSLGVNNTETKRTTESSLTDSTSDSFESDIAGDIIDTFAYSNNIGYFLYICKQLLDKYSNIDPADKKPNKTTINNGVISNTALASVIGPNTLGNTLVSTFGSVINNLGANNPSEGIIKTAILNSGDNQKIIDYNNPFDLTKFEIGKEDLLFMEFDNLGGEMLGDDVRYYIRLGTFLNFLQLYMTPVIYNKKIRKNKIMNFDIDENTNLMNVNPLQTSVDPRICFVNRNIEIGEKVLTFGKTNPINPFINDIITNGVNKQDILYGNIMNIYLEFTFILKKINELKDDQGNIPLIDFLKGLLSGLNEGLGGLNNFDVFIDETNNMIKIIDQNPLNEIEKVIELINANFPGAQIYNNNKPLNTINTSKVLELYGYKTNKAGFINNFSLTTELTPAFSTMITAGAAARGTVVGENDTALSKLNKGFEDRYNIYITNNEVQNVNGPTLDSLKLKIEEFKRMKNDYLQFLDLLSNVTGRIEAEDKDINTFKNTLSSLVQKAKEIDIEYGILNNTDSPSQYQGTGFIPFNLSLTMNGLSGIKINQQFLMDTEFLPTNYPNVLRFLIKNLSHEIQNNKWTTKIETYSIPKAINNNKTRSILVATRNTPQDQPPVLFNPENQRTNLSQNRDRCSIKTIPGPKTVSYKEIADKLKQKNFSKAAIAGILGNIQAESSFNINAFNREGGGCGAYGLVQWRGDRQTNLFNYAKFIGQPIDSIESQIGYLIKEIPENLPPSFENINDPGKAAFLFASKFERFAGAENPTNPSVLERQRLANNFFKQI